MKEPLEGAFDKGSVKKVKKQINKEICLNPRKKLLYNVLQRSSLLVKLQDYS